MDTLLLYVIVAGALGLMAAGAYGAAPVFLLKREPSAHGPRTASVGGIFTLGAAFPLLEDDLAQGPQDLAAAVMKSSASGAARGREVHEPDYEEEGAGAEEDAPGDPFDEEVLSDLFTEIGMLRLQIEVLRTELGAFATKANTTVKEKQALVSRPPGAEPRKRLRTQPNSDLPVTLKRRLSDVRRKRRPAS